MKKSGSKHKLNLLADGLLAVQTKAIKENIVPAQFRAFLVRELHQQDLFRLVGKEYESPYLTVLRELGFKWAKSRLPKRQRDQAKAVAVALLKEKFTMKQLSQRLGFTLNEDSYGNLSYSKTGRRYVEYGRKLLRAWKVQRGFVFGLDEDGLPEMYADFTYYADLAGALQAAVTERPVTPEELARALLQVFHGEPPADLARVPVGRVPSEGREADHEVIKEFRDKVREIYRQAIEGEEPKY